MAQNEAKQVYETVCRTLDGMNCRYRRLDEDLTVSLGFKGEDLPMDVFLVVDPKVQVLSVICPLPFKVGENKRVEVAMAVALANYGLINGSFDYDLSNGNIRFRLVTTYRGSLLGEEAVKYMTLTAVNTLDRYNDKFLMVAKGMLSIQQFLDWEQKQH